MASVKESQKILKALGMPPPQCNSMSGMTLLALCGLAKNSTWSEAVRRPCTITKGIMYYIREHFGIDYAANTRETFRRQVLHQFIQGRIADYNPFNPDLPTNSPNTHYAITKAALAVVQLHGTSRWKASVAKFRQEHGVLTELYGLDRDIVKVPIRISDGTEYRLSPGKHNEVQKSIIEEFAPRFAPDACLLYLGDTAKKDLFIDENGLARSRISITDHGKLPDVVLYDEERNWLFLVEAVTSHGPMTPKRIVELEKMLVASTSSPIYVSVFPDFTEFRQHMREIAWETEVWIASAPDHMIHYDGDRFLGPRKKR